jgi:hypothetical protein
MPKYRPEEMSVGEMFVAAMCGSLPRSFAAWDTAGERGWTIAHQAAQYGNLPADFDKWSLATQNGETVAHIAAKYGNLPNQFADWHLADGFGETVAEIASEQYHRWIVQSLSQLRWPCDR